MNNNQSTAMHQPRSIFGSIFGQPAAPAAQNVSEKRLTDKQNITGSNAGKLDQTKVIQISGIYDAL